MKEEDFGNCHEILKDFSFYFSFFFLEVKIGLDITSR